MEPRITGRRYEGVAIVAAEGRLGLPELPRLERAVRETRQGLGPRLILDLTRVRVVDSSVLGLLIRLHLQLRSEGGRLILVNPQPTVQRALEVTRLNTVLEVYSTMDQALRAFEEAASQAS
ncbi:MAG: hypothetical protein KatS3mg115_1216 [Candidatus Poribacteria bacterium]|nr:MAG: hypothetical protein KatS3mg115_1216 [Candidatus Poribacteria bacterium]